MKELLVILYITNLFILSNSFILKNETALVETNKKEKSHNEWNNYTKQQFVNPYDPDLGKEIAAFALNSYCKKKKIEKWNCGKTCRQYPDMKDIIVIQDKVRKNQAYLGYYEKLDSIVISWRGTLALRNWLEDFDFILQKYPYCQGCKVHEGFWQGYNQMQDKFWDALYTLQKSYPKAKLILTGQSLGAAFSTFCAADMITHGIVDFTWYNYGSPRPGNKEFAKWVQDSMQQRLYRVVHKQDPVPHLPPLDFGFWHIAQEVFYIKGAKPHDDHILCNMSGEDPDCSDRYSVDLAFWNHLDYMGYNWVNRIALCLI